MDLKEKYPERSNVRKKSGKGSHISLKILGNLDNGKVKYFVSRKADSGHS